MWVQFLTNCIDEIRQKETRKANFAYRESQLLMKVERGA